MNREIADFFDKFYQIALKDHIKDPLLHSEWSYFQSMLSNPNFERDRIKMYLNILQNDKKKKESEVFFSPEPKFEKRYSEPYSYTQNTPKAYERSEYDNKKNVSNYHGSIGRDSELSREGPNFKRLTDAADSLLRMFEVSA